MAARNTASTQPVGIVSATAFDRLRVYASTGNFTTAGTLYVLGRKG